MSICCGCERQLIVSNEFRQKCLLSNDYLLELRLTPEEDNDFDTDDDTPLNSLVSSIHSADGLDHPIKYVCS